MQLIPSLIVYQVHLVRNNSFWPSAKFSPPLLNHRHLPLTMNSIPSLRVSLCQLCQRDYVISCRSVRICDPTTQSHSRAEPKDPICSPYLSLLRLQPVSASLPDLSPPYCTSPYFTFFTSIHLLISHLSPVPPIFPSVRLCYPDFLRTLIFHPYLLCSTRVVFKISSYIPYPQNLHCYFLLPSAYPCSICSSCLISKSPRPCVSVRLSESVPDSDRLAPSIFGLLCIPLRQYLQLYDSQ